MREHLIGDRFDVLPAPTGEDALRLCRFSHADLMLLDLGLPNDDALKLIPTIREADGIESRYDSNLPIIALTGSGSAARVRDLDRDVDDYLQKPFGYEELRSRITAVLRRRHSRHDAPVRVGDMTIDPARRLVTIGDREVKLAKKEFTLLRVLASNPTCVFSKDELLRDVWGLRSPSGRTRTLDSHASRLRRKLDPENRGYVINCWGVGYRLVKG
jgi:DNA-binding response OmpR family regulator